MGNEQSYHEASKNISLDLECPSLVECFRLENVNGCKTIELSCETSAKIVSAQNGSGKTTLLNALYGVLSIKPVLLQKINFECFSIKLAGKKELKIHKDEFCPLPSNIIDIVKKDANHLLQITHDEDGLIDALTKLALKQKKEFLETDWVERFYKKTSLHRDDILTMCEQLIKVWANKENKILEVEKYVNSGLDGATVLYLPTYRRIEAEMPQNFNIMGTQHQRRYARRSVNSSWESDQLIYFGLKDVENKFENIAESIRQSTLHAYTKIGGQTLERLSRGSEAPDLGAKNINIADLRIVLARLGMADSDVENRIIKLIDSGDIKDSQYGYLTRFLGQLLAVYASGKEKERAIEKFVEVINSYWSNDINDQDDFDDPDMKRFVFDKHNVSTRVESCFTEKYLQLSALSSGEKQIISVFARLYLSEEKRFIVLIDEPELSLSIDWQKRFLPDILRSPSCAQMVAITHSPFVFDNELDPCAGPLKITFCRAKKGKK